MNSMNMGAGIRVGNEAQPLSISAPALEHFPIHCNASKNNIFCKYSIRGKKPTKRGNLQ